MDPETLKLISKVEGQPNQVDENEKQDQNAIDVDTFRSQLGKATENDVSFNGSVV